MIAIDQDLTTSSDGSSVGQDKEGPVRGSVLILASIQGAFRLVEVIF